RSGHRRAAQTRNASLTGSAGHRCSSAHAPLAGIVACAVVPVGARTPVGLGAVRARARAVAGVLPARIEWPGAEGACRGRRSGDAHAPLTGIVECALVPVGARSPVALGAVRALAAA